MIELIKRVLISVIAIPLLLFIYYYGQIPLIIFLILLSLISSYELSKMLKNKSLYLMASVIPFTALMCYMSAKYDLEYSLYLLFFALALFGAEEIFRNRIENAIYRVSSSLMIMVYCGVSLGFVYRLHGLKNGNYLLPFIAILIWITDTFAYFIGVWLGRHRNIFNVSPKKSIEGFIGGFVFAVLFAIIAHFIVPNKISLFWALLMGIVIGTIGQFGDLFESLLKRDCGVKDSSNLIPGHGGILDRFDSFMIAVPVIYILYSVL